ncbi:hypothetical protein GCM10023085_45650 [Actinomadura viridis]
MDAGQSRDAVEMPLAPHRGDHIPARHPACWIHLAGGWRRGWIQHWLVGTSGWLAWVQYEDPDGRPWPRFGMFAYDEEAVRPREEGQGPPD